MIVEIKPDLWKDALTFKQGTINEVVLKKKYIYKNIYHSLGLHFIINCLSNGDRDRLSVGRIDKYICTFMTYEYLSHLFHPEQNTSRILSFYIVYLALALGLSDSGSCNASRDYLNCYWGYMNKVELNHIYETSCSRSTRAGLQRPKLQWCQMPCIDPSVPSGRIPALIDMQPCNTSCYGFISGQCSVKRN